MAIDTIVPTTELEAINAMRSVDGTTPLEADYDLDAAVADGSLPSDVEIALNLIRSTSRGIQSRGWQFNAVREVLLERDDITFKIATPSNALKIRKTVNDDQRSWDIAHRNGFLWNNLLNSSDFSDADYDDGILFDIVYALDFDELPEPARQYIFIAASRRFTEQTLGNADLSAYIKADEALALAALVEAEGLLEDTASIDSLKDQKRATDVWNKVSKQVQQTGWHFNSVKNVPLTPDDDGFLYLPDGTLRASKSDRADQAFMNLAHRGTRMFDVIDNTYVFDTEDITGADGVVYVDLVMFLTREELPEVAVKYIDIKASRQLQPQRNNTPAPHGYTEKDEYFALRDLQDDQGLIEDNNLLVNMSVYRSVYNRPGLYGSGNIDNPI